MSPPSASAIPFKYQSTKCRGTLVQGTVFYTIGTLVLDSPHARLHMLGGHLLCARGAGHSQAMGEACPLPPVNRQGFGQEMCFPFSEHETL